MMMLMMMILMMMMMIFISRVFHQEYMQIDRCIYRYIYIYMYITSYLLVIASRTFESYLSASESGEII